ncbi:N-acetyltransferase [Pluralibacter gergoviae]|uniref:GNAT family N-acetyltransferase n=1 Tax=Pluralibacter gergoviae TaxID=61647 RepID=UPI0005EC0053|nr:GNAT family N-acetyltransferase [Pluralibacter gergoviae]KJM64130.1 GCN5 family acetyltransferase [Pluralibacter gergoviae]OUR00286.1 N-acetyltransferase [Pluralibacter gergoviae]
MTDITTPRLRLTPFTREDWPFFLRLRQDPAVMRYMGEIAAESVLRTLFAQRIADGAMIVRSLGGEPLGDIGLRVSVHNPHEADVGYALVPEAQGKGYAGEALAAVCEYGFRALGLWAINAWVLADNAGSARLLERCGFRRIQVLTQAYTLNGVCYDDWVYRLEAPSAS